MSSTVTTTLVYFDPPKDGSQPYAYLNPDEKTGERRSNWTRLPKEVQITDLRGKEDTVSLDTAGFQYEKHEFAHKRFTDDEEIKREYYPECADFFKKLTGASRVFIFDHTVRRRQPGLADHTNQRQPVPQVHGDQTPLSAEARIRLFAPDLAPELLKHRYQIINLWRPISHPAFDHPLALCDYRSVSYDKDLVASKTIFPDREGETFNVIYRPEHRWNYVRGLKPDELVLIKCFDSKMDGSVAIMTPHTAFDDPTTPKDAPLRQSIEVRAILCYDD